MQRIKLILPTAMYKEQVLEYKKEFELHGDSMDGTSGLSTAKSFEEWLEAVEDNLHKDTVREGLVTASTYLAIRIDDGKLVGMIQIRHELNDYLIRFGGHIGYSVRKSERRKGFAKEMLKLALMKCKDLKIERALVTCDKENIASAKTILGNGGVLENEVDEGERITQRYWIRVFFTKVVDGIVYRLLRVDNCDDKYINTLYEWSAKEENSYKYTCRPVRDKLT